MGKLGQLAAIGLATLAFSTPASAQNHDVTASPESAEENQRSGGQADIVLQPEPPGLMLGLVTNAPTQLVAGQIYESFLRYDAELNPLPSLAKSWEISEDGLTYTFHLQENVTWHDGQPFTSADALFSINDFLLETQARHRSIMENVAEVTAPDDHTVVFRLDAPYEPLIRAFAFGIMPMVPRHIYEGTDYRNNPMNDTPVGTGPFKFEEWDRGSSIHLVKNEDYWMDGRPYLDDIYYHIIPDGASRAIAFENGIVDILPGGAVENFDVPWLSELPGACMVETGWEYYSPQSWMWINTRRAPMDDRRFRQAIMYAMDREFAQQALWNGLGNVADGPIAHTTPFHSEVAPQYDYDPDKARALLAEMGYEGEEPLTLLPLPYGETWQRWAEAVRQNLAEVGIPVRIASVDVAGWNQRVSNWDFDLAFTYLFQNGDPALGVNRSYVSSQIEKGSPWNNVSGFSNPEVDRLLAEAATAFPADARQAIYDEAQSVMQEEVPVAWLLDLSFPTVFDCRFQDISTTANGVMNSLRDTWIAEGDR